MWHKGCDENLHHKQGDDLKGCSAPAKDNIVQKYEANRAKVVFEICFIHERINLYLPIWPPLPHCIESRFQRVKLQRALGYNEKFFCIFSLVVRETQCTSHRHLGGNNTMGNRGYGYTHPKYKLTQVWLRF